MEKKIAYAVFTTTDSGKEYLVKGNFGDNVAKASAWALNNAVKMGNNKAVINDAYPNGLIVKQVKY